MVCSPVDVKTKKKGCILAKNVSSLTPSYVKNHQQGTSEKTNNTQL